MTEAMRVEHEPWPNRAYILLALGALLGLIVHFLIRTGESWRWTEDPARIAAAATLASGGIVFAFSLERLRWKWSIPFAMSCGLIIGLITYWNGSPDRWGSGEGWRFCASLLAIAAAVPLYQAIRDSGSRRLDVEAVHDHVWTNVILWFLAWAFMLVAFLLAQLLGALFDLIGLDFLRRLLGKAWFGSILFGGVFGAAVGMLRDRQAVLGLLQRVARTILSVLAPVLAVGLVLFVLALPFTGLKPLWDQTSATTPILLACVLGAFILANAVVGNSAEEESSLRILRWSSMALAAVMLPLAIVASISMAKRIGQYGYTPDRLWAVVVVAVAVAGSAAWLVALVQGRFDWSRFARRYNVALAAGVCLLALFLALPIVSFGSISARDQLARLQTGKVSPERFDWTAMRFDFGPAGERAVERLARTGSARQREFASAVLALNNRWDSYDFNQDLEQQANEAENKLIIRVRPDSIPLPPELRNALLGRGEKGRGVCSGLGECLVHWKPGDSQAIVIMDGCAASAVGTARQTGKDANCRIRPGVLVLTGREWKRAGEEDPIFPDIGTTGDEAMLRAQRKAIDIGDVSVREVKRRQLFVGDKPVGEPFQ